MKHSIVIMFALACFCLVPDSALAQNISICGKSHTVEHARDLAIIRGDILSSPIWCQVSQQSWINKIWQRYKFDYSTWQTMGFYDLCNVNQTLNKIYSVMRVVDQVKGQGSSFPRGSYATRIVDDQLIFSKKAIDSTRVMCIGGSSPSALASVAWSFDDVRYHKPFFTNQQSIAALSATVIHEARHTQGWSHVSNANGSQVDRDWAYDGAYKHTVVWLNHLYLYGNIEFLARSKDSCTEDGRKHRGDNQTYHWNAMLTKGQSTLLVKFLQKPAYVFKPKWCGWTLSEQPRNGG